MTWLQQLTMDFDFFVFSISGYNITILAYGQTGSGKTYLMSTTYNGDSVTGVTPWAKNIFYSPK